MTNEEITEYIFLDDPAPQGDVALVFGTWNSWHESVVKAVELYKNGFVKKVLVSGGVNKKSGVNEGDVMAQEVITLGVPEKDVLNENRSTNTLENVLFSKELIEKELGLDSITTIVGVVKNYHARRALMTMRKHFPANIQLKAAAYYSPHYNFTKENWQDTEGGIKKVLEEIEKIKTYLAKGDLALL